MNLSLLSKFDLSEQRVVLVTNSGVAIYHWEGRKPLMPLWFLANDLGIRHFSHYLQQSPWESTRILVDIVEEDFHLDKIPHVFGADRKAVIRNKQYRLCGDSKYVQAIPQGRERDGRRDDRMLFTSIIRPQLLDQWLDLFYQFKVPIIGIYSLPILSESMLKPLDIRGKNVLMISSGNHSGLRQTFFQNQQLKVSRLAPMQYLDPFHTSTSFLKEIDRSRHYLHSIPLLSRNARLDVWIISHGEWLIELAKQAQEIERHSDTLQFHLLDKLTVADKLKMSEITPSSHMDAISSTFLARTRPSNYYSIKEDRYRHHRSIEMALSVVSVLVLIGGISWSGLELANTLVKYQEVPMLRQQVDFHDFRHPIEREYLPELPANDRQIAHAVKTIETIQSYHQRPDALLVRIGRVLEQFPDFRIDVIHWRATSPAFDIASIDGTGRESDQSQTPYKTLKAPFQSVDLQGSLPIFAGDYQSARDVVHAFAGVFERMRAIEKVEILPLSSNLPSRRESVDLTGVERRARFEIQIILKPHDISTS